jgi:hypothetical protein
MLRLAANETAHSSAPAWDIGTDWPRVATRQRSLPPTSVLARCSIVVMVSPSSSSTVSTSRNVGSTYDSPGSSAARIRTSVAFIVVVLGGLERSIAQATRAGTAVWT